MTNYPSDAKNATFVTGDAVEYTYSLDDQCRMEFGLGFGFCRSFPLADPCAHLWCAHRDSQDVCKTKKGPPMDGTGCGDGRWCVDGACRPVDGGGSRRMGSGGVRHNVRDGGWGEWGPWGDCSRTCGAGAEFRSRQCDSPRPAYGGRACPGRREEFRVCGGGRPCPGGPADFRAEQCAGLFGLVGAGGQVGPVSEDLR